MTSLIVKTKVVYQEAELPLEVSDADQEYLKVTSISLSALKYKYAGFFSQKSDKLFKNLFK